MVAVADGVVLLDLAGPVQVLQWAGHRIRFASPDGRPVRTEVGLQIGIDCALGDVAGPIETLIVPGYAPGGEVPAELVTAITALRGRVRQFASVCTGAFVLAEAGLLDGRRATTHWAACADLAARFPAVRVDPDALYVRDGSVVTSAGVTAGIDMALSLVEAEHGAETAARIAKYLVVFLHRPGGQSQFSVRTSVGTPRTEALRRVLDAVVADLSADHRLAALAARAALSPRHLTRLFRRELGMSPGQYIERVRVEAAQAQLTSTGDGVATIARRCGFGSEESMRRVFQKALGVAPSDYRQRFGTATA
ncbi:helix-turn-helix domain-containing protein [Nocardia yunnanensis]|uniref:Helix-turn-helix domain-containing protein n=1 Tax=Nocardia yunnanensis TaxID=2382165 RepID=A0A386ZPE1_9NOCA|nr:helix-turn-helix domain-containing protein [Nocardia yunnanensis]